MQVARATTPLPLASINGVEVDLALSWLFQTNLVEHSPGTTSHGGMKQGYNWRTREYPFVYSEITGYAISMAMNAYRWTSDPQWLTTARSAAAFLIAIQKLAAPSAEGAIAHGRSLPDHTIRHQYHSFDTAMCIQGLLDLHELRPNSEILQAAQAAGNWLVDDMQRADGAFLSQFDADTGAREHSGVEFYSDSGCLHVKHAICLLKLARATGDDRFRGAAIKVCDWALNLQHADGAFPMTTRSSEVVSHAHAYAIEGLLFAYDWLADARYLDAARMGGIWLRQVQLRDGAVAIGYKQRWWRKGRRGITRFIPVRVTDATAQALRIWLILYALDGDTRYLVAAQQARSFLRKLHCVATADLDARGGLLHTPGNSMMYAWSAMFAAQAFRALDRVEQGEDVTGLVRELF